MQGKIKKPISRFIQDKLFLSKFLKNIDKPNILEFGVQLGSSTKYF